MKPSLADLVASLLAIVEGERLVSYQDSGEVWTIGFGHTKDVKPGQFISHEEAVRFMQEDLSPLFLLVAGMPVFQAAALVSFGYNCGRGALQLVLAGKDSIDNPKHTQDKHGTVLPWLVKRRRLESILIQLGKAA